MAYCAVSSITAADWHEIRKLCKEIQDYVDKKLEELDSDSLDVLKENIKALQEKMTDVEIKLAADEERIDSLEENCANKELTTEEVIKIYEGV